MTQVEALKAIAARNDGLLRPQDVVDAARPEDSPLHGAFCWDDTEAARLYRLEQAQRLIRSFRIVHEDGDDKFDTPVFVNLSTDRTEGKANNPYRLVEKVAKDPDLMVIAENDAMDQLRGLKSRYGHLKRLGKIWAAIDAIDMAG